MSTPSKFSIAGLLPLSGLALALVLGGCKSAPAPRTDDVSLNAALQSRLQSDPGLTGQPLQATVENRVVTLSGNVDNAAARVLAANDAAEVPGVTKVINNLALGVPPTTPAVIVAAPPPPVAPAPSPRLKAKVIPPPRRPAPIDRREPAYAQNAQNEPAPQPFQAPEPPPPPPPAPAPPAPAAPVAHNITIPEGTSLSVRVTQTLDSASTQPGTTFTGVLASDLIVEDVVAFPAGTKVSGHVDDAKDAGHFSGNSILAISLNNISRRGESYPITTDTFSKEGKGRGKNTAEKIGGGAAVGAILGGIFGGGKGAAIGAGAGGGLGAGANGVTRGEQVQIPSETVVRFRLTSAVTVRVVRGEKPGNPDDLQHHNQ